MMPLRAQLLRRACELTDGNDAIAEDLVQETLLRMWELRDQLDRHPNPEALAMTILRNKTSDHWRRSQRIVNQEESFANRAATTELHDDMEVIEFIIDNLPPLQQKIFRMKEIEGYEKEEIMLLTGCTDESLRQNLSRARKKIREQFIKMTAQ